MRDAMKYNPALDGLRAIAVFAVLAFHAGAPLAGGGYVGVDLFFVLSGFLITTILMQEQAATGRIAVGRFYWRRALRLYPTLLLVLAAFLVASPYLWPELPAWRYAAMAALYVTDYTRALLGEPEVLSYTWSLSVEEHFYLLWPLVLPIVLRQRRPVMVLAAAYLVATIWRVGNYHWLGWDATYFRFDTRLSGLILGCLLAMLSPFTSRYTPLAVLALIVAVAVPSFHVPAGLTGVLLLAEGGAVGMVIYACSVRGRASFLAAPALAYLGRLSYGIYLWHFPVVYWLRERFDWTTTLVATAVIAVALAAATYHFIDVPLQRYRRGLRPADHDKAASAGAAQRSTGV
jgi:peptidoglycan/LPS O-acetylase OafA/YrhL